MDLHQKALRLSYFTVGYNIIEGLASILAGALAGSVALVGFGLDSFVESLSGSIMVWRFRRHGKISAEEEGKKEKKAVKWVAATFFILGAYVLYESADKLYRKVHADPSGFGIIIALVSMAVMPVLFLMKYRTARALGSRSLLADAKQTLTCMFLSVSLLVGLWMNYAYRFWQADPMVGLIIVFYLFKEGVETWQEGREKSSKAQG